MPAAAFIARLNHASAAEFVHELAAVYEDSPWLAQAVVAQRPFASLAALKYAMQQALMQAEPAKQLALICAHPELAGKAAIAGELSAASTAEQSQSGLLHCSADEYAELLALNQAYRQRFGFPFILAIKGPAGLGLNRQQILASLRRRLRHSKAHEFQEALQQIGQIANWRLNQLAGFTPMLGQTVLQQAAQLAQFSELSTGLSCTYLTPTHQQTREQLAAWMRAAGLQVQIDALGNVCGRYPSSQPQAKTLLLGSHYDSVVNAGAYDGRAGILIALAVLAEFQQQQVALPFHLELIAFAEEEGVRFGATFLGSRGLTGRFNPDLLNLRDANQQTLALALQQAGFDASQIPQLARNPADLLGYLELHIEQGPQLLQQHLPLGIVSAIVGSRRLKIRLRGLASHAGTTPMAGRRDAAVAAAEFILAAERIALRQQIVATVGKLEVPQGAVNVIPGLCEFTLDLRAADNELRDAAWAELEHELQKICQRRDCDYEVELLLLADAVSCEPAARQRWATQLQALGLPTQELLSGAGHDAMELAQLCPVSMLFIRCWNDGISHHPLESLSTDDADLAAQVLRGYLLGMANADV